MFVLCHDGDAHIVEFLRGDVRCTHGRGVDHSPTDGAARGPGHVRREEPFRHTRPVKDGVAASQYTHVRTPSFIADLAHPSFAADDTDLVIVQVRISRVVPIGRTRTGTPSTGGGAG